MVVKQEVLDELDVQELDKARSIDLSDKKPENGLKGKLVKLAGQLRDCRNEPNQMVSERVSKHDDLNMKIREKAGEVQRHHEKRDEMNSQVQEYKQSRNGPNAKASELFDEIGEMRGDFESDGGKDIDELKGGIEQPGPRQQAEVLSVENEHELTEKIESKHEELRQKKDKAEGSGDLEELIEGVKGVRSEMSQHHQKVTEPADDTQEHHNQMIEAYREANDICDKADEIRELSVEAQEATDRHHEDFARTRKRLRELDKKEERQRKDSRAEERKVAKAEAEEIYQKFREGEILETEGLMKLRELGPL